MENTIVFHRIELGLENKNEEIFDINTGNHFTDLYIIYKDLRNGWMESKLLKFSKSKSNQITIGKSEDIEKVFMKQRKIKQGTNTISYSRKIRTFLVKEFLDLSGFNVSSLMITDNGENLFSQAISLVVMEEKICGFAEEKIILGRLPIWELL